MCDIIIHLFICETKIIFGGLHLNFDHLMETTMVEKKARTSKKWNEDKILNGRERIIRIQK